MSITTRGESPADRASSPLHIPVLPTGLVRGVLCARALALGVASSTDQKYGFDDVTVEISRHTCRADFDASGRVSEHDIYLFLDKWLSGSAAADFNGSDGVTMRDIFDFLSAWFAGCGGGA